ALLRGVVGENFGVKASGGIRDRETAIKMILAGANRIGTSTAI
ncbi:MAG: 2-deoxyribose-5-phosphate aldolase, partial [Candidatus Hydrothermia bacterium]